MNSKPQARIADIAIQKPQRSKSLQLHRAPPPPRPKKSRPSSVQAKPAKSKKPSEADHHRPQQQPSHYRTLKPVAAAEDMNRNRPPIQRRRRSNSAQPNYAGPMFNNAPEPSTLPLPGFARPRTTSFNDNWRRQQQFPSKMVASHGNVDTDLMLAEIQQRLCSVLKLGTSQ